MTPPWSFGIIVASLGNAGSSSSVFVGCGFSCGGSSCDGGDGGGVLGYKENSCH